MYPYQPQPQSQSQPMPAAAAAYPGTVMLVAAAPGGQPMYQPAPQYQPIPTQPPFPYNSQPVGGPMIQPISVAPAPQPTFIPAQPAQSQPQSWMGMPARGASMPCAIPARLAGQLPIPRSDPDPMLQSGSVSGIHYSTTREGIESFDPKLNTVDTINSFISALTHPPRLTIHITGSHTETTYSNVNSDTNQSTESNHTVIDFQYSIDCTSLISPVMNYSSNYNAALQRYIVNHANSSMREFNVRKVVVDWRKSELEKLIIQKVRSQGYTHGIAIAFHSWPERIAIRPDSAAAKCCHSTACCLLSWLTGMCICFYCIRGSMKDGKTENAQMEFPMLCSVEEWFAANQHLIWAPNQQQQQSSSVTTVLGFRV